MKRTAAVILSALALVGFTATPADAKPVPTVICWGGYC